MTRLGQCGGGRPRATLRDMGWGTGTGVRRRAVASVLLVIGAVGAVAAPGEASGGFAPSTLPVDSGGQNVEINDVSCWAPGSCVAVGDMGVSGSSQTRQVVVQQSGGTWSQVTSGTAPTTGGSPYGRLDAVSCTPSGHCVAVGRNGGDNSGSTGLIVTRDGGTWSALTAPSVAADYQAWLTDVSCSTDTSCAAVGLRISTQGSIRGLAESWDGTGWTASATTPPPVTGSTPADDVRLFGVSCWAEGSCVGVGFARDNGSGSSRGILATLASGTWTTTNAPEPSNAYPATSDLRSVACAPTGRCAAAGTYGSLPVGNADDELLTRGPGGGWTAVEAPLPAGTHQAELSGASCAGDGTCAVAAHVIDSGNQSLPAVYTSLSGSTWAALQVTLPPDHVGPDFTQVSDLATVACTSASYCVAGGWYATSTAYHFNGLLVDVDPTTGSTAGVAATLPADAATDYQDVPLAGASCLDATHCTLVGTYQTGSGGAVRTGLALTAGSVTPPPATPVVSGVSPRYGTTKGGDRVTVTGSGFTGATKVTFGGTAGRDVVVVSGSKLKVTAPAHSAGAVHVRVTTPGGQSASRSADQFTYLSRPTVTSVRPRHGTRDGGTKVTIEGSGFKGPVSVAFGTKAGTKVTVLSPSKLTVKTPAHQKGSVSVTVTTAGGTSAASTAATYRFD